MASKPKLSDTLSIPMKGEYGYQTVFIYESEDSLLGRGSYGSVFKAKLDDLPCAAKVLHKVLFNPKETVDYDFITRFQQECYILRDLKHPNIVQFLGMVHNPNSGHLILLMEMVKQSLTKFLELPPERLPFHLQVNISHDIALAVAHLHRNRILHRDLSSNNILITQGGCQAKVTDFGMAKIAESNKSMTRSRVTQCPGTLVYMPPEALYIKPRYSEKLDTFSLGVLMIQIMTKKFPTPSDAQNTIEDPRSPTGEIIVPVSEVIRREGHIREIPESNALLPVAKLCLKDKYQERPDAAQLCQTLEALKATPAHVESSTHNLVIPDTSSQNSVIPDTSTQSSVIPDVSSHSSVIPDASHPSSAICDTCSPSPSAVIRDPSSPSSTNSHTSSPSSTPCGSPMFEEDDLQFLPIEQPKVTNSIGIFMVNPHC